MNHEASFAGVRILIADDSNTIRRSADVFLRKAGCEVMFGEDGFDALSKIPGFKPDLIFVDIMMPKLDGYQVCAVVKQNPRFQDTPVVMLTSKDNLFDRARARLLGANDYLTKPFTRESLLGAVSVHVRGSATHRRPHMTIKNILVVDDSPTERAALAEILARNNFAVTMAENGEEAITKAKERANRI